MLVTVKSTVKILSIFVTFLENMNFNRRMRIFDKINLYYLTLILGWDRYRGGLDVHNNMTGTESVFTLFEDHQIMFHVSQLLPFSSEDTQQVRN